MNRKFTVLVGLLMAVAVTGYSVSGTYAKYTEDFASAESKAAIAKWDIAVSDLTSATNGTDKEFAFDLFKTVTDDASTLINTDAEGNKIIAPGTSGEFAIKMRNNSDVKAGYFMTFNTTGAPTNLEFCIADDCATNDASWTKGTINAVGDATTLTEMNTGSDSVVTVQWRWAFGDSIDDTADASTAAAYKTATVKANVTVSQMGTVQP